MVEKHSRSTLSKNMTPQSDNKEKMATSGSVAEGRNICGKKHMEQKSPFDAGQQSGAKNTENGALNNDKGRKQKRARQCLGKIKHVPINSNCCAQQ